MFGHLAGASGLVCPRLTPEVASAALNLGARTVYDLQGTDFPGGKYSPSEFSFTSAIRIIGVAKFGLLTNEPICSGKFDPLFMHVSERTTRRYLWTF